MGDPYETVREKVVSIFFELVGEKAKWLNPSIFPAAIASTITAAFVDEHEGGEDEVLHTDEIAFHLTDWNGDAAFLVALHLFPERFTSEEIRAGVDLFLVHVPAHVIAAARLHGNSVDDAFKDDVSPPVTLEKVRAKRDAILRLGEKRRVANVRIFGSVARGDAKPGSDLDVLVDTLPGSTLFDLGGLAEDLKELFGINVDVADAGSLKEDARPAIMRDAVPL